MCIHVDSPIKVATDKNVKRTDQLLRKTTKKAVAGTDSLATNQPPKVRLFVFLAFSIATMAIDRQSNKDTGFVTLFLVTKSGNLNRKTRHSKAF